MADYPAMYRKLFNAQTDAITILQKAQQETEELYLSAPDPEIRVLELDDKDTENNEQTS